MLLSRVEPLNFGPFRQDQFLTVEPDLTVITGHNDVGKSRILRCIRLLLNDSQAGALQEDDVNSVYQTTLGHEWRSDQSIGCQAEFQLRKIAPASAGNRIPPGATAIRVTSAFAPNCRSQTVASYKLADGWKHSGSKLRRSPLCIALPRDPDQNIRTEIPLAQPTAQESELLSVAFGGTYDANRWTSLSTSALDAAFAEAEDRLTKYFKVLFPAHADYGFRLRPDHTSAGTVLRLMVRDGSRSVTPVDYRGAGIRRALRILGVLQGTQLSNEPTVILIDEPESSLHPDAQHFFRSLLEDIASKDHVQVIYATHSPAMLNAMRPESVRLIERDGSGDKSRAIIKNNVAHQGFLGVRVSLGVSVADTLHLAPATLIVEGVSEAYGIPLVIKKMGAIGGEYSDVVRLFGQVAIWDCGGDDFDRCCGIAKAQNLNPILWLDGDKRQKLAARQRKTQHLKDVPVIELPEQCEFEDLLSRDIYFQALAGTHEELKNVNLVDFEMWEKERCAADSREMFSKRVARWLQGIQKHRCYHKVNVMRQAIALAEIAHIQSAPFRQLICEVRRVVS